MLHRLARVRLRLGTPSAALRARTRVGRARPRVEMAHRRRILAAPRVSVLLPVLAVMGLAVVAWPGENTTARKTWTWTPLPESAFGSLPSLGGQSPRSSEEGCAGARSSAAVPVAIIPCRNERLRPAATPAQQDATSVPPSGPSHLVAPGDDLWTIARRHSADLAAILKWNEGINPYRLVTGQRILVPGGSEMGPLAAPSRVTVRSTAAPTSPRSGQVGGHIWPLAIRGTLTTRFSSAHPGIDIAAPKGTVVRAVAAGRIVWAGWKNNGGGYVVEIAHPNGMRTIYNHNSKLTVKVGDLVARGATIARVGSTGWSTGPHLDFRMYMGGRFVNPLAFY